MVKLIISGLKRMYLTLNLTFINVVCHVIKNIFKFVNSSNRTSLSELNSNGGLLLPCDLDRGCFSVAKWHRM